MVRYTGEYIMVHHFMVRYIHTPKVGLHASLAPRRRGDVPGPRRLLRDESEGLGLVHRDLAEGHGAAVDHWRVQVGVDHGASLNGALYIRVHHLMVRYILWCTIEWCAI